MSPEEILSLPIQERRKVVDGLDDRLAFLKQLKTQKIELPADLEILYEILEQNRINELPRDERLRIFNQQKEEWCKEYPDFKKISELVESFNSNQILKDYSKHSPPEIIQNKAIEIYKKCLSFRVSLTNRQLKSLVYHSTIRKYCINPTIVDEFVKDYQQWNSEVYKRWNDLYYLKQDFNLNTGYKSDWKFYIKHPNVLSEKVAYIQKDLSEIIQLLNNGQGLIERHNSIITEEYKSNSFEMSFYERELEISRIAESDNRNDEEYCYVYTLECELCVFYVGIAANPKLRFEQHIRSAVSDEKQLFKSKFIQKYHGAVKQNLIFEGTRRECKNYERNYISKFLPLGNMTVGGEG